MTEVLNIEPPSYDGFGFEALVRSSNGASDLPAYTRRPTPPLVAPASREPRDFTRHLKNHSGVSWGSLTVQGDPRLTKSVPTILEGSDVVGSVQLTLKTTQAIQAVCVNVKGEIMGGAPVSVPQVFLDIKHVLWSAAEGDPNAPESSATGSKLNGLKLRGDYSWSFAIALPPEVTKDGKTYRLPHSFMHKTAVCSIGYTVELRVVRGKLRPDDKLPCPFAYFSMRQPTHPSSLRMLAYQENSPLLGPDADPGGWQSYPLSIKATLFASRVIEVKLTYRLNSQQLSYTRSASIPCAMAIETSDKQAMDLLSGPSASLVYLERTTQENQGYRNSTEPCGQAVFWPSTEGGADSAVPNQRRLMGEIHLRGDLQPTSAVLGFAIEYAVVVFPLQAAGFKPVEEGKPILKESVEITTRYGPGPRQKTYSPPAYEGRNLVVDQYYYHLVIQNAVTGARMQGRGRSEGQQDNSIYLFAFYVLLSSSDVFVNGTFELLFSTSKRIYANCSDAIYKCIRRDLGSGSGCKVMAAGSPGLPAVVHVCTCRDSSSCPYPSPASLSLSPSPARQPPRLHRSPPDELPIEVNPQSKPILGPRNASQ
ncbi:hypothetical protein C8F01DRAFT_1001673 [Mycena amicta]|nr:hypothetical protein C8F01DRAFT_1001673 [Mycena amicta]